MKMARWLAAQSRLLLFRLLHLQEGPPTTRDAEKTRAFDALFAATIRAGTGASVEYGRRFPGLEAQQLPAGHAAGWRRAQVLLVLPLAADAGPGGRLLRWLDLPASR